MSALPRNYLFVPASQPQRFAKAVASGADAVIVDLEDAVAAADKDAARASLAAWLSPAQPVYIRINGADSPWFAGDLALCGLPGVAGVIVPKAEAPAQLAAVAAAGAAVLIPLIESARGLWQAHALACCAGVQRLMFGSIDYCADLAIAEAHETLLHARSQLVLVSKVAGIAAPVDGVSQAIDDAAAIEDDCRRARALGFGAKLCIHPRQLAALRRGFAPTAAELAWAGRVLALAAAGGAAIAVDGRMVDLPVLLLARRLVEDAAAAGTC